MRHEVPFISQYQGITDPAWQWRGCGITALKMVMDFWHAGDSGNRTTDMETLFREGTRSGAYREGVGWSHAGLVALARAFGYEAYNRDWAPKGPTPKEPGAAFTELIRELESGPVLVSVFSGLNPARGGGHIVVMTGTESGLVYFSDPEQLNEREGVRVLAAEAFAQAFKARYVVVRPAQR
ncbi:MAG TPA: C39 family peptidase [Candidatus Paceibacterota bacterium]|nr:C39 family peptidase [Candidatus Paceibacterota bacterium]